MALKRKRNHLTVKQRIASEVSRTPACKFWMPFSEGSGEDFTEQVSRNSVASSVTSTYDEAHAINTFVPNQAFPDNQTISGNFIAITINKTVDAGTNSIFYFGFATLPEMGLWMGNNRGHLADAADYTVALPATAGVAISDAVAGVTYINAMVRNNGVLTEYRGVDGGAVAISGDTADIPTMLNDIVLADSVKIGSTDASLQGWYGALLLDVDTVPEDLAARLQGMSIDYMNGIKTLSQWYDV